MAQEKQTKVQVICAMLAATLPGCNEREFNQVLDMVESHRVEALMASPTELLEVDNIG